MKKLSLGMWLVFVAVFGMGAIAMDEYYFDASQITSGTLSASRLPTTIPALAINADQITGGNLSTNRLPATINATTAVQVGGVSTLLPSFLKNGANITWNTSETNAVYPTLSLAAPPAIGGTTPAAGAFTTMSASGLTTLGTGATGIKMKVVTGTTGANQGDTANIAHGLGTSFPTNFLGVHILLTNGSNLIVPCDSGSAVDAGFMSSWYLDGTYLHVKNHASSSGSILGWTVKAIIWYTE